MSMSDTSLSDLLRNIGMGSYSPGDLLYAIDSTTLNKLAAPLTPMLLRGGPEPTWDTLTSSDITDFNEAAQDATASLIQNGTGITWVYNDASNTFTPTVSLASFSTSNLSEGSNLYFTDERAQDAVGGMLTDTSEIDFTYNDGAATISATIVTNSIVYAKLQPISATNQVLGRISPGAGNVEELTAANIMSIIAGNAQTWSQLHTFGAGSALSSPSISLSSSRPLLNFFNSGGGSNAKNWLFDCDSSTTFSWRILNDALTTARNIIAATRAGNTLSSVSFGNATDNNSFSFLGTGAVSAAGSLKSANATGGIGYGTGAGSTVSQATSRTTGVTINNVCGSITLVSAAGSATYQTFTVTNSAVAVTDKPHVVQKSGTDKYLIHTTNVQAGQFDVTFATTGGTTTEQPVFTFAVIKAVAA